MLEQLFGSRTRVKLLRLFLSDPDKPRYVRELTRIVEERINSVRRELNNLSAIGLMKSETRDKKRYYFVDKDCVLYPELRSLVIKTHVLLENDLVERIKRLGSLQYFVLTGAFTGAKDAKTDMLLVGQIDRAKLAKIAEEFEKELDREINYTVIPIQEYRYRLEINDQFLFNIMTGKHIVLIDDLKK